MPYPVVLLSSWILASILENVEPRSRFVSDVVVKKFLVSDGPNASSVKYTPLVRIFEFVQTTPRGELVALVNDSTHKIPVVFTREAIQKFEVRYGQRLTFQSVYTLVILRRASLKFISMKTHKNFIRAFSGVAPNSWEGISLLYFEVSDVEFFLRDQHNVPLRSENALRFIYEDPEYQRDFLAEEQQKNLMLSGTSGRRDFSGESTLDWAGIHGDDGYDGMVSEADEQDLNDFNNTRSSSALRLRG